LLHVVCFGDSAGEIRLSKMNVSKLPKLTFAQPQSLLIVARLEQ